MKARDVMISSVITVTPSTSIRDVAKLFLKHKISGVPVVDGQGTLVGMLTEGDLIHRAEAGTERQRFSWLGLLAGQDVQAADYVKAHARKVADLMSRAVITASPDASLSEVAAMLEKHAIKRVPIVANGKIVGIVSRANIVQAVASAKSERKPRLSDGRIREKLLSHLQQQSWTHTSRLNVTVDNGIVNVWGLCYSEAERNAIRIAAENIAGVRAVNNNLAFPPIGPMY